MSFYKGGWTRQGFFPGSLRSPWAGGGGDFPVLPGEWVGPRGRREAALGGFSRPFVGKNAGRGEASLRGMVAGAGEDAG